MKRLLIILLAALTFYACGTTANADRAVSKTNRDTNEIKVDENQQTNNEFALENYLKRAPGVVLLGSGSNARVQIRGVNSFNSGTEPLFVVNGTQIGNSYSQAVNVVRGLKITSVKVLKDSDASMYGVRGGNGVIVIKAQ